MKKITEKYTVKQDDHEQIKTVVILWEGIEKIWHFQS